MAEFLVETGLVKNTFTGVGTGSIEVFYNPTDIRFSERIVNAVERIGKKQESYEERNEKISDHKERFALMDEADKNVRAEIDGIFDAPVCDAIFGNLCVVTSYANGLPIGIGFLMQIIDDIDTTFAREQKCTNARVSKYLDKYKKYKK